MRRFYNGFRLGLAGTALSASLAQPLRKSAYYRLCACFSSSEVIFSSLAIGAIAAALLSTVWLVRQKGNLEAESQEIRGALSDAQQRISKYEALIADKNRSIVIWEAGPSRPGNSWPAAD